MSKTRTIAATEELIALYSEMTENERDVNSIELERYDITKFEWDHFIEWTRDLDLNLEGIKILLEEMLAGHIEFSRD